MGVREARETAAAAGPGAIPRRIFDPGAATMDILKHPLLPYQVEGALHLAFGERVLLADDMGLGKTVQAIAACALLAKLRGVRRVLVVSPASLKEEWREQIAKFADFRNDAGLRQPGRAPPGLCPAHVLYPVQLRAGGGGWSGSAGDAAPGSGDSG